LIPGVLQDTVTRASIFKAELHHADEFLPRSRRRRPVDNYAVARPFNRKIIVVDDCGR
jgi:hypothetical protein